MASSAARPAGESSESCASGSGALIDKSSKANSPARLPAPRLTATENPHHERSISAPKIACSLRSHPFGGAHANRAGRQVSGGPAEERRLFGRPYLAPQRANLSGRPAGRIPAAGLHTMCRVCVPPPRRRSDVQIFVPPIRSRPSVRFRIRRRARNRTAAACCYVARLRRRTARDRLAEVKRAFDR